MDGPPFPLEFGEWMPDMPDYNNPGSPLVMNVLPRTPTSFGPFPAAVNYSGVTNALNGTCQGSAAFVDLNGNVNVFAGTSTKQYLLSSSTNALWSDVSKGGGYAAGADFEWEYALFNGTVIATDYSDNVQAFTLGTSATFADLAGTPPRAKHVATVRAFVVLGNTFDNVNGVQSQRVWWSAINNPTSWPTPGSSAAVAVQSSFNDITGDIGAVQSIVGNLGNADGAIFFEHAVWRMIYTGPPDVFTFLPAEGVRGTPCPYSTVQFGSNVYFIGEDGVYSFDGINSQPIGANKIDKYLFANLSVGFRGRVFGAADPLNKKIYWGIPGNDTAAGEATWLLCYDWQLNQFTPITQTCEMLGRLLTVGYTLDQLQTVLGYNNLDTLPYPLDSPFWQGGAVQLGMFDLNHKLNFFSGANMAATMTTKELQLFPGHRSFCRSGRPLVDGGTPLISIGHRERMPDPVVYSSPTAMNSFGLCPQRVSGRYIRAKMTINSGDTWTNSLGAELDANEIMGIR